MDKEEGSPALLSHLPQQSQCGENEPKDAAGSSPQGASFASAPPTSLLPPSSCHLPWRALSQKMSGTGLLPSLLSLLWHYCNRGLQFPTPWALELNPFINWRSPVSSSKVLLCQIWNEPNSGFHVYVLFFVISTVPRNMKSMAYFCEEEWVKSNRKKQDISNIQRMVQRHLQG